MGRARLVRLAVAGTIAATIAAPLTLANPRPVRASASTSSVKPGTKEVLVNGSVFTGKGYLYWPSKIGTTLDVGTWADPTECENDAQLLQGAGATLMRVSWDDNAPAFLSDYQQCAQSFFNHGIGFLWLIQPPESSGSLPTMENDPQGFISTYEPWIQQAVNDVKDWPATYMYSIGNELDGSINGTCSAAEPVWMGRAGGAAGVADALISYTKSLDSTHIVGTDVGACSEEQLSTANVPSADFWGIHPYGESHDPGTGSSNYFTELSTPGTAQYTPKPVLVDEMGTDRYNCNGGGFGNGIICAYATSGEDQAFQRSWDVQIWNNIAAALSSDTNPGNATFGGTYFMYSDLWWYSLAGFNPATPEFHDVYGSTSGIGFGDGVENFEWWGLTMATTDSARRVTTQAFDGLAALWSSNPQPTISNASVNLSVQVPFSTCAATVSFDTAVAGNTEIYVGLDGRVLDSTGIYVVQDNTIYGPAGGDGTQETVHTNIPVIWNFVGAQKYFVVIRSTTAAGMSATTAPIPIVANC